MKLCLDDDIASGLLRNLLLKVAHGVKLPTDVIMAAQGHHPGILVVRKDNDPRRDLDAHGVVRAISNLLATAVPIADQYIVLNHWR